MESAGRGGTCGATTSRQNNPPGQLITRHTVPIAIPQQVFSGENAVAFNESLVIKVKGNIKEEDWPDIESSQGTRAIYGLSIGLGGRGARVYGQNLQYGYWDSLSVGDTVERKPGTMRGPFKRAIQWRIDQDPNAAYNNVSSGSTRVVYFPVVDVAETVDENHGGHGHGDGDPHVRKVTIRGFAAFFIDSYSWSGGYNKLRGRFIRWVPGPEAQTGAGAANYGMTTSTARLIP